MLLLVFDIDFCDVLLIMLLLLELSFEFVLLFGIVIKLFDVDSDYSIRFLFILFKVLIFYLLLFYNLIYLLLFAVMIFF
jgi:hypothetical protein